MTSVQPLNDRDLYRLVKLYDAPDFVKDASLDELVGGSEDHATEFADPMARRFSLKTKAATWASAAAFADESHRYDPARRATIANRIGQAAARFEIAGELAKIGQAKSELAYSAIDGLPDAHYAWVEKQADGSTDRRLRIHNAVEVKTAADWLLKHRDAFAYDDRMKTARRIMTRARQLGVEASIDSDAFDKVAGFGYSDPEAVVDAIQVRTQLAKRKGADAPTVDLLEKLAEGVAADPSRLESEARRVKLAALLDDLDRTYDLVPAYDRDGLVRPEDAVFAITEKTARDYMARFVPLKNGALYEKSALAGVDLISLREYVGDEFADRISDDGLTCDLEKFAAVAPGLPRTEADFLQSVLEGMNVKPAYAMAPEAPRLDRRRLLELAAEAE